MIGARTLFVNPPLDRRHRLHAAGPLPGARGSPGHDQAAVHAGAGGGAVPQPRLRRPPRRSHGHAAVGRRPDRAARRRRVPAHADRLPEHDADARRRRRRDGASSRRATARRSSASARTPRARQRSRWRGRRRSTACSSASRKTACWRSRSSTRSMRLDEIPSLTFRPRAEIVAASGAGQRSRASSTRRIPAWDLLDLDAVPPAARQRALRDRRDVARLPVLVRLLRRADPSGPQVPREEREGAGRRDGARLPPVRPEVLLSLGRHGHAEREDVQRVLRRADRAQAADAVVRQRARRQPDRSRRSCSACARPAAGCSRSASRPNPKKRART